MNDILKTIEPKSDQLNADDLLGGRTVTIKIISVTIEPGDQPVSLHYEGDNGKPYKPGKSMRRVIVNAWGVDIKSYIGRRMTLYRDDKVIFGGVQVGGIRISHMSDISKSITIALTATRTSRKPFTVEPLIGDPQPNVAAPNRGVINESVVQVFSLIEQGNQMAERGPEMLKAFWKELTQAERKAIGAAQLDTWKKIADEARLIKAPEAREEETDQATQSTVSE